MSLKQSLNKPTFGMPRWAFIGLLAGGLMIGLYLRHRRKMADEQLAPDQTGATEGSLLTDTQSLGASSDPGLAGVGVASPPGGVYPVSSPVLPEGYTDVVSTLGGTVSDLAGTIATLPESIIGSLPSAVGNGTTVSAPATVPVTGGGPPSRPDSHRPAHTPARRHPSGGGGGGGGGAAPPKRCSGSISRGEYLSRLDAIRKKHGAGSAEVNRYRARWNCNGTYCCPT